MMCSSYHSKSKMNPTSWIALTLLLLGYANSQISSSTGYLKVETVAQREDFDDALDDKQTKNYEEYRPTDYMTISIGKGHNITITEYIKEVISGRTHVTLSFHCLTRDFKLCNIYVQVMDAFGKDVYSEYKTEGTSLKLTPLTGGEIKINFINNDRTEKQVSIGMECVDCGKDNPYSTLFLSKEHLKEKVDRIKQLQRILGAMMMLTANTKKVVARFTSSKILMTQTLSIPNLDYTC